MIGFNSVNLKVLHSIIFVRTTQRLDFLFFILIPISESQSHQDLMSSSFDIKFKSYGIVISLDLEPIGKYDEPKLRVELLLCEFFIHIIKY